MHRAPNKMDQFRISDLEDEIDDEELELNASEAVEIRENKSELKSVSASTTNNVESQETKSQSTNLKKLSGRLADTVEQIVETTVERASSLLHMIQYTRMLTHQIEVKESLLDCSCVCHPSNMPGEKDSSSADEVGSKQDEARRNSSELDQRECSCKRQSLLTVAKSDDLSVNADSEMVKTVNRTSQNGLEKEELQMLSDAIEPDDGSVEFPQSDIPRPQSAISSDKRVCQCFIKRLELDFPRTPLEPIDEAVSSEKELHHDTPDVASRNSWQCSENCHCSCHSNSAKSKKIVQLKDGQEGEKKPAPTKFSGRLTPILRTSYDSASKNAAENLVVQTIPDIEEGFKVVARDSLSLPSVSSKRNSSLTRKEGDKEGDDGEASDSKMPTRKDSILKRLSSSFRKNK